MPKIPPVCQTEERWTCEKCGTSNMKESYFCKVCGNLHALPTQKSEAIADPSPTVPENSPRYHCAQHWRCPECYTENSLDTEKCTRCGYTK